jgi:hypothetical protein
MRHASRAVVLLSFALPVLVWAQKPQTPAFDHHEPMPLSGVQVSGTRLPAESIIRISGLKVGDVITDERLKEATDKITSTGLVKGIDYGFDMNPGKPGVFLSIHVFDEEPLLPVRIEPADIATQVWSCLESADPIFKPEMPNTEKAIHFYSVNMARCLGNSGAERERVSATVACDGSGKSIAIDFHLRPAGAR